jgi:hypothetical protein
MPVLRLQVSMGADTAFPRDRFVITPHFNVGFDLLADVPGGAPDVNALCNDLAHGLSDRLYPNGQREIEVKGYNAQGPAPHRPLGRAIVAEGQFPESPMLREAALCLSFYAGINTPRRRGRLYFPLATIGGGASIPIRPPAGLRDGMATYANLFQNLGGTNVDWCVYSRRENAAHSVTNWWVDDEWDIQRRRGLRPTTRSTGTTSEAGLP